MIKIFDEEFKELIERTVSAASRRLNFNIEDVDVEFGFVSPDEIRKINAETRENDSVTDVLSFQNIEDIALPLELDAYPAEINGEDGSLILGEILICREKAVEQSEDYGHSLEREVGFLACHGLLHLLGFDHDDEEGEAEMNRVTEDILFAVGLPRKEEPKTAPVATDVKTKSENFRSGFVAVLGKPNAGKSTLINTVVGEKVAIVSWKPQTTRNKILGIYNEADYQIIFIDTPGLHTPKNSLGKFMMKSAHAALDGADAVVYVVDCEKGYDEKDKFNIVSYINAGLKVIVAVNKVDHVTKEKVYEILTELNKLEKLSAVVPVSALRGRNIQPLITELKKLMTDTVQYYGEEQYTDKNMRFCAAEIIREKALRLLDKEVPYGVGVDIREYEMRDNGILDINADIICEKPAHKPIILGKGGGMIKKIATYSRQDLEEMTGSKVYLTLFVRVKDDWRGSDLIMKELGYDPKNLN